MNKTLREIVYQCMDPECGHTYVAHLEIVRTLSPSANPDPSIVLPYSPKIRTEKKPAVKENTNGPARIFREKVENGSLVQSTVVTYMPKGHHNAVDSLRKT